MLSRRSSSTGLRRCHCFEAGPREGMLKECERVNEFLEHKVQGIELEQASESIEHQLVNAGGKQYVNVYSWSGQKQRYKKSGALGKPEEAGVSWATVAGYIQMLSHLLTPQMSFIRG